MLMSYFMVVLLLWLFIVIGAVILSILVFVIIVAILLVLKRVKTRKGKFDILIIMTINITYIGRYNGILPQDNKNSNELNSEL